MTAGRLPRDLSGQNLRKALERAGFSLRRQRGSHMVLFRADPPSTVVVTDHDVLKVGLLRRILEQAGLTTEALLELLR